MKKYLGFIIASSLALSFSLALAEDGAGANSDKRPLPPRPMWTDMKDAREGFKSDMKGDREAFRLKMEANRKAFSDKLKTDRDAFMADLKAKKEAWKAANSEQKKEFWNRAKDMVANRFEMALSNLENMQTRVGEVITKLKADGKDTADATEALNLSKQKLSDAKAKLAEIKKLLSTDTSDTITGDTWEKVKLLAREAKDLLKESKESLHDALEAIKSLRGEDKDKENDQD